MKTLTDMNAAKNIASRDFGKKRIKALEKKGIEIVDFQQVQDENGSWANAITVYVLSFKGCAYVREYHQVLNLLNNSEKLGA